MYNREYTPERITELKYSLHMGRNAVCCFKILQY